LLLKGDGKRDGKRCFAGGFEQEESAEPDIEIFGNATGVGKKWRRLFFYIS
jgi:hypothetical protein